MNMPYHPAKIEKYVGAKEFLQLIKNKRNIILQSRIVLPKLGHTGLGGFKVTYIQMK